MTSDKVIGIGLVGAGRNTRVRHIPGFQAIEGVRIVGVVNRSRVSSETVARDYGIPKVFDTWLDLVQSEDVDAVCIGTWPYMHCAVSLAALDAGKHVLTEARMASTAEEARAMLGASRRHPELLTQVVPSPFTLKVDRTIQNMIARGYLGTPMAIELRMTQDTFPDFGGPLHWRHDQELSGYNTMSIGIWYESLLRWLGPATRVMALSRVMVNQRRSADNLLQEVTVPDHIDILCDMACGAQAHLAFSSVTGLGASSNVWLFGTEGTLHLDSNTLILKAGRRGDTELKEVPIPIDMQGGWRVEEEFVNAIRGLETVTHTTFEDGAAYMEFTEAVARSAQSGIAVSLPL